MISITNNSSARSSCSGSHSRNIITVIIADITIVIIAIVHTTVAETIAHGRDQLLHRYGGGISPIRNPSKLCVKWGANAQVDLCGKHERRKAQTNLKSTICSGADHGKVLIRATVIISTIIIFGIIMIIHTMIPLITREIKAVETLKVLIIMTMSKINNWTANYQNGDMILKTACETIKFKIRNNFKDQLNFSQTEMNCRGKSKRE